MNGLRSEIKIWLDWIGLAIVSVKSCETPKVISYITQAFVCTNYYYESILTAKARYYVSIFAIISHQHTHLITLPAKPSSPFSLMPAYK